MAAAALELLDAVAALLELALEDGEDVGVAEFFAALFDFGVLDGGFEHADGAAAGGVLGAHGGLEVFAELFAEAHGRGSI